MRLTERGRWVLVYLPAFTLYLVAVTWGGLQVFGPDIFKP